MHNFLTVLTEKQRQALLDALKDLVAGRINKSEYDELVYTLFKRAKYDNL